MSIEFKTSQVVASNDYPATLLEFQIGENGNLDPSELRDMDIPEVDGNKGVIVSGRGPVWLYGHLLHHLHVTRWAATFDPRQGAVVVSTHHKDAPLIGEVLSVPKSE